MNTMAHSSRRSLPIIGRLVWKDTRRMAAFFVAMIGLAIIIQGIIIWTIRNSSNDFGLLGGYAFGVLGGFAALFAAACGATSFSAEKEERTFDILQRLPLSNSQIVLGKLLSIFALGLTFLIVVSVVARFWMPSVETSWQPFFATFAVGTFEFFAWSLLFSVLMRSPLNAALAGIFCASAGSQLAVFLTSDGINVDYASLEPYAIAWKTRLTIASIVFAVAIWKAKDWLSTSPNGSTIGLGHRISQSRLARERVAGQFSQANNKTATVKWNRPTSWVPSVYRLTWQSVRQNWLSVALAYSLTIGLAVLLYALNPGTALIGMVFACLAGGFAAVAAFSSDMNRNRSGSPFLAMHGASPNITWFSRVAPWIIAIGVIHVVVAAVLLAIIHYSASPYYNPGHLPFVEIGRGFGQASQAELATSFISRGQFLIILSVLNLYIGSMLCFFVGQFTSIVVRSRALAMVATAIVCLPLIVWSALMLMGEVSIWTSVFPFIVAFAIAGWLAFRARLLEKFSIGRASLLCGMLAIVPAVLVPAVIHHRANEFPAVEVNLVERDLDEFNSLETQAKFEEIRIKFSEPLSTVNWPGPLVNSDVYRAISHLSNEEIQNDDTKAFGSAFPSSSIKDSDEYWGYVYANEKPTLADLKQRTESFLDEHSNQIVELQAAIDFAYERLELFNSAPPLSFGEGKKELPIPDSSTCSQLLRLDFHRQIRNGNPRKAWDSLRALTKRERLVVATGRIHAHWYTRLFDHYSELALCKNQTPELLAEVIEFAREEFHPISWQRILEYERANLLYSTRTEGVEHNRANNMQERAERLTIQLLRQLPSEQERARRLINIWTVYQQNVQHHNKAVEDHHLLGTQSWAYKEAAKQLNLFERQYEKWLVSGPRNTIAPRPLYNSFFKNMDRFPDDANRQDRSDHANARMNTKLAILQMEVIRYKLEKGKFPETLEPFLDAFDDDRTVFYYPEGKPSWVVVATRKKWKRGGANDRIAPTIPFLSSQPVVAYPRAYTVDMEEGGTKWETLFAFSYAEINVIHYGTIEPIFVRTLENPKDKIARE